MKEAPIGGTEKTGFCMTKSLREHPQNGARTGIHNTSFRTQNGMISEEFLLS